jgi:hypothetical protein
VRMGDLGLGGRADRRAMRFLLNAWLFGFGRTEDGLRCAPSRQRNFCGSYERRSARWQANVFNDGARPDVRGCSPASTQTPVMPVVGLLSAGTAEAANGFVLGISLSEQRTCVRACALHNSRPASAAS